MDCSFLQFTQKLVMEVCSYPEQIVFQCIIDSPLVGKHTKECITSADIAKKCKLHHRDVMKYLNQLVYHHFVECSCISIKTRRIFVYGINFEIFSNISSIKLKLLYRNLTHNSSTSMYCRNCFKTYEIDECLNESFAVVCPHNNTHELGSIVDRSDEKKKIEDLYYQLNQFRAPQTVWKCVPASSVRNFIEDTEFHKNIDCVHSINGVFVLDSPYLLSHKLHDTLNIVLKSNGKFWKNVQPNQLQPKYVYSCNLKRARVGEESKT